MDLVWLVYAISLLRGFGALLLTSLLVSAGTVVALLIYRGAECSQESWYSERDNQKRAENAKWAMGHVKTAFIVLITSATFFTLLPSERTAYMMVGAYAAQKVAENEKVQETGSKVLKLINQKLDGYIDEGLTKATEKIKEEVKK